jgi:hypothetical protein
LPFSKQAKVKQLENTEEDEEYAMSTDNESNSELEREGVEEECDEDRDTGNESEDDVKPVDDMSDLYPGSLNNYK